MDVGARNRENDGGAEMVNEDKSPENKTQMINSFASMLLFSGV